MQRFDDRIARIERDQEVLRSHYDRLYGLNIEAIEQLRQEVREVRELVQERRLPAPTDVPTIPTPRTWHQNLRAKRVPLPAAGIGAAILWALVQLVQAIASGQISFR